MSHVLLIDNYDSFTYNLVQALMTLGAEDTVRTNDRVTVDEARELTPSHLMISPGPGRPEDAGVSIDMIESFCGDIPILGVCLGHQALAVAFGGSVGSALSLMHGKSSPIYHDRKTIYEGVPNPFPAGRYHSLAVHEEQLPDVLSISAYTSDGEIMGVRHRELPVEGVQFHPESLLTPAGDRLLQNFLERVSTKSMQVSSS